jgi:hypothetical protein
MSERSVKRQAVELLGALALLGVVLFGGLGLAGYGLLRVADENVTHLDKASRAEIERSGCARLRSLFRDYSGGIDSTNSAIEGVEAILKRSEKLHCDPPIRTPRALESN